MTFYHPLLKPLEKKFGRPFLICHVSCYYLDAHPSAEGHQSFWTLVKPLYPHWRNIASKWGSPRMTSFCPEFPEPSALIGWAYETFLRRELDKHIIRLTLSFHPLQPLDWESRLEDWSKDNDVASAVKAD